MLFWLKLVVGKREMGSLRRVTSHDYVNGVGSLLLVALCGVYIFLSHIKCCIYKMDV